MNSKQIDPYRTSAHIEQVKSVNIGPEYGLIKNPNPPKIHTCKPPGVLYRMISALIGKPVTLGSVFRCQCGTVHEFVKQYEIPRWDAIRKSDGKRTWMEAGGIISTPENED